MRHAMRYAMGVYAPRRANGHRPCRLGACGRLEGPRQAAHGGDQGRQPVAHGAQGLHPRAHARLDGGGREGLHQSAACTLRMHMHTASAQCRCCACTCLHMSCCFRAAFVPSIYLNTGRPQVFVPYRRTKLTLLMKDVFDIACSRLCSTVVLACVSALAKDAPHTLNTLGCAPPWRAHAHGRRMAWTRHAHGARTAHPLHAHCSRSSAAAAQHLPGTVIARACSGWLCAQRIYSILQVRRAPACGRTEADGPHGA